jgi:hypothetical protein
MHSTPYLCTVSLLEASIVESLDFRCCLSGGCAVVARTGVP